MTSVTHTRDRVLPAATVRLVIDTVGLTLWVEDMEHDTWPDIRNPVKDRVATIIDGRHLRLFTNWYDLTSWLLDAGYAVRDAFIMGPELSDEERFVAPKQPAPDAG